MTQLKAWKENPTKKPLLLKGARQVGKTYILKELGQRYFHNYAYVNCDNNPAAAGIFSPDYNIDRIVRELSALTNQPITPDTLIIIDEIQEAPAGLHALKYFHEQRPDLYVAVAGSLLGVALHSDESFPVGMVDILEMYPMTFDEFLLATGSEILAKELESAPWDVLNPIADEYVNWLRQYYFTGGMPEVVKNYLATADVPLARKLQNDILTAYQLDISKHAPVNQVPRINMVWRSIPSQLARENKKFIYGALKKGARANDFEIAIQWLQDAGLVYKIPRVNKIGVPLAFYEDLSAFKLYMLDCGLFGALSATPPELILVANNIFSEYKGAFTEQYALQQLIPLNDTHIYYYTNDRSTLELDFILQHGVRVYAVEVKAEENLKAKSLRQVALDNPQIAAVRLSMSPYRQQSWMTNVPLWAASRIY